MISRIPHEVVHFAIHFDKLRLHFKYVRHLLLVKLLPLLCLLHIRILALMHECKNEVLHKSECLLVMLVYMPDIVYNLGFLDDDWF